MKAHWTQRTIRDYLFRIAADFIAQLEKKMEAENMSQDELAKKLKITKGRVSQVLNHPGNISLAIVAKYARALGMKMSIIAYEDGDPENIRGPINSEIFKICWEACGKPHDFWELQETEESKQDAAQVILTEGTEISEPVSTANATPRVYYFRGGVLVAGEMSPSGPVAPYGRKEPGAAYMLGGTHETKHAN
jgi:transcriptional regulator with XRE-family HTH domain